MTFFEKLHHAVHEYIEKYNKEPSGVSLSMEYVDELTADACYGPHLYNYNGKFSNDMWIWGMKVQKVYKRKNYIECLPRIVHRKTKRYVSKFNCQFI